ncbi:uncharacterized protein LOC142349539 [Convolutriloba macropyga]|uniref:uncharacterized protein LOC142349539 n=1 Tax=Convolutriloba macropyga TaxID=536237 RepID=UPI003F5224AD
MSKKPSLPQLGTKYSEVATTGNATNQGKTKEQPMRLNKSGNRRGMHDLHHGYRLPKLTEEEEERFLNLDIDQSLKTKKFKFSLKGSNVVNFIYAVIRSPLVQSLLSEEFLASEQTDDNQGKLPPLVEAPPASPVPTQVKTRAQKRKLPPVEDEDLLNNSFLALLDAPLQNQNSLFENELLDNIQDVGSTSLEETEVEEDDEMDPDFELPDVAELLSNIQNSPKTQSESAAPSLETIASRTRKRLNLEREDINKFELPMNFDETESGQTFDDVINACSSRRSESFSLNDDNFSVPTPSSQVDEDDVTWKHWLRGLASEGEVEHLSNESDSQDSDPDFDYNLYVYKAELRKDKLEKFTRKFEIPQEEKEALVQETLNYLGIKKKVDLRSICKTIILPKISHSKRVNKNMNKTKFNNSWTLDLLHDTLKQQLQQFTQLVTQNFLLSKTLKNWQHVSDASRDIILQLHNSKHEYFDHITVDNLEMASKIVSHPFPYQPQARGGLPNPLLRVMLYSEVFMYRELLPYVFFCPSKIKPDKIFNPRWSDPEDCLIALGVSDLAMIPDRNGRMLLTMQKVCELISRQLLPMRSAKRIMRRYYFLLQSAVPNPVKYLDMYKELPPLPVDVSWMRKDEMKAPFEMVSEHPEWPLPMWMQILRYLDNDQGKQFVRSCQNNVLEFSDKLRKTFANEDAEPEVDEVVGNQDVVEPVVVDQEFNEQGIEPEFDSSDPNEGNSSEFVAVNEETLEYPQPDKILLSKSPQKFRKSPAKIISDKLVKRAIKTSLTGSPKKIIKVNSPSKFSRNFSENVKMISEPVLNPQNQSFGPIANQQYHFSNEAPAQKRTIKRRKNWQQSKRSFSSMVLFVRQSFNPEITPELESRIESLKEELLSNIYDALGDDHFELFLSSLGQLDIKNDASEMKVEEIKALFAVCPNLYFQLAKIVDLNTALLLGLYFEYRAFERAKLFLQKVELCTYQNPKLFNVILDTFASSSVDETSIWNNVTPLIEFNPLLIDEFSLFFKDQPIPEALIGPFEEILITENTDLKFRPDQNAESSGNGFEQVGATQKTLPEPIFEEFVLLDDDDEAKVKERAARKVEKRPNKTNSSTTMPQSSCLSQCIVRDLMSAKMEQLTTGKVDLPSVSAKKIKRPVTPAAQA